MNAEIKAAARRLIDRGYGGLVVPELNVSLFSDISMLEMLADGDLTGVRLPLETITFEDGRSVSVFPIEGGP